MKYFIAFILSLATIYPAVADKRYISDELWINLRSGAGNDFRILKTLKSGTHLNYIEMSEDEKWTHVTTDKGLDGWVPSRFLKEEPIAFEKLILTQRELDKSRTDLSELQGKHSEVKKELAAIKRNASGLDKDKGKLQKELDYVKKVSASAISLDKKNQDLMTQNEELKIAVDTLRAENERLQNNRDVNYILVGGFLIVLGLFLGWLLPKLSGRKGDGWA